jgi:thymidylate kinase
LFIVEGPDGAGKTTYVNQLHGELERRWPADKIEVLHRGPPPPNTNPLDEYALPLLSYRPGQNHHIICDRWHWGEWVYPAVLKRATLADDATWWWLDMLVQSRGAVTVYADTPHDIIVSRLRDRGDDLIHERDIDGITRAYDSCRRNSRAWQVTTSTPMAITIDVACSVSGMAERLNGFTTYVGSPTPEAVLIGEVRNGVDTVDGGADLRPAFMPYGSTSGHYLLSSLNPRRYHGTGPALVNACDVDDIDQVMLATHFPPMVTLGRAAHKKLRGEAPGAPHPQFIRRFYHRYGKMYDRVIDEALFDGRDNVTWRPFK